MNVTLILAVIVVSGVVAYVGDIIGKRLGKKRVSLFGLRPRQTAVLIAVCTGWVITAGTILALAIASKSVREAVFTLGQLHQQIAQARGEATEAQNQRDAAFQELAAAAQSLESTEARLRLADTERNAAEQRANTAEENADRAEGEVSRAQGELKRASGQVSQLRTRQGWLETGIKALTREADAAKAQRDQMVEQAGKSSFAGTLKFYGYTGVGSEVYVFEPGDELARAILPAHTGVEAARAAIDRLMAEAAARAQAAGSQPYDSPDDDIDMTSGLTIILRRGEPRIGPDWKPLTIQERLKAYNEYLQYVAQEAAKRTEMGERAYVTLNVWDYRAPKRRPVIAEFNMGRVVPVFRRGAVLATRSVSPEASRNDIATAIREALADARAFAVERGVVWRQTGITELPYEEQDAVIQEVLRLRNDLGLSARLSVVVTQEECLSIDQPEYQVEVDPLAPTS